MSTMKYVTFAQPGEPSVLRVEKTNVPSPGEGEVLIEVEAAGVARADAMQRAGKYPPPHGASPILGLEVAGTIVGKGPGVAGFAPGDRVVALLSGGGYAQYAVAAAGQVLPLPDEWSFIEGATLPENVFTVYDNLITRGKLSKDEVVLVHGGTSGIGTTAIQLARAIGARVISTAGSREKCEAILQLGADAAINYRTSDFVQEVQKYTNGRGVDLVLDIVGGSYIGRDLQCLALDGRIVCLGTAAGVESTIDLRFLLHRRATILGTSLRPRTVAEKAEIARGLMRDVWPLLPARNPISPLVDSVFTFSDAARAHERMESSEHIGKIVLVPDP